MNLPRQARRAASTVLSAFLFCVGTAPSVAAQQPFLVDDAEVAPRRLWHVEVSSQVDVLRPSARPVRWQNVLEWEVNYGVGARIELAALLPLVSLVQDAAGGRSAVHGPGDSMLAAKWRLTGDPNAAHATAVSVALEIPSGSRSRGLGTGLVDYGLNLVSQHRLHSRATLRVNGGALLAGNTQTGAVGIKERGTVLTTGTSLVWVLTRAIQAGGELTLAWSQKATLAGSAIGWQLGANIAVRDGTTLDASVLGGWLDASPTIGVQIGMSIDLR